MRLGKDNDEKNDQYWIDYLSKVELEPDLMDEIWIEMKKESKEVEIDI